MPALGQKQTFSIANHMSALPRKRTCAVQRGMSAKGQKRQDNDLNVIRFCRHRLREASLTTENSFTSPLLAQ